MKKRVGTMQRLIIREPFCGLEECCTWLVSLIPDTTGIVSAVYYPYAVNGYLTFLNPMIGLLSKQKVDMIDQHSPYTSECISLPSRTGSLIIFNSLLTHFAKCEVKDDRISLAYNAGIKWKR